MERAMMDWGNGAGWLWWMVPMTLLMVAVIGTIVWALLTAVRGSGPTSKANPPSAAEILDERFARGEIDASEYRERMDALKANRANIRS
jgi:putative membrane protein